MRPTLNLKPQIPNQVSDWAVLGFFTFEMLLKMVKPIPKTSIYPHNLTKTS